jgi:hypothetical protein
LTLGVDFGGTSGSGAWGEGDTTSLGCLSAKFLRSVRPRRIPVTPAESTDFKDWPKVDRFLKKRISMQYEDLRKLMQERGFSLLAVAGLCDLVSGLSVSLYKPAVTKKWIVVCGTKKQVDLGTGDLFKLLLETYYPWQKGERHKRKSEIIYKFVRNPLAHSLRNGEEE